jgi:hypothetical protein
MEFLNLLDDLSYFIYHNTTYDGAFTYISDLSWEWVNAKWIPIGGMNSMTGLNLSSAEPGWVPKRQVIVRFRVKG